jgi:hypothetical protein
VIIFQQFIWLPIWFSIVALNTLRLISTLFVRKWLLERSVFFEVALGEVNVLHVPISVQFADIFTKRFLTAFFTDIRSSLNIVSPRGIRV